MELTKYDLIPLSVFSGFEPTGMMHPESRLLGSITICGTPMHLEAYEVKLLDDEDLSDRSYEVVDPAFRNDVHTLEDIYDCAFQTTEIAGRAYILVATPYSG